MVTATKIEKQVIPLLRYFVKRTSTVIYEVASSEGDPYRVTLAAGRGTCTCKGFRRWHHCYHVTQLLEREASRNQQERPAAAPTLANRTGLYNVDAVLSTVGAAMEASQPDAYEVLASTKQVSQPTYGKCGHLHKNEDDYCGACKSRWY